MHDDIFFNSTQDEIRTEEEFREAFFLEKDFSDCDDSDHEEYEEESEESFYLDGSNKDENDDDLPFDDNVDNL